VPEPLTPPPPAGGEPAGSGVASAPDAADRGTPAERRTGLLLGLACYLLWGVIPLYFALLEPAGAVEIVAERIIWSLFFCLVLLGFSRGYRRVFAIMRNGRLMALLTCASLFIAANWVTFTYGVQIGQVVEISLGYFINPLLTVLFGVIFLKERLSALQWSAMGIGALAVIVIGINYGRVPWLSLAVALSFSVYGLLKNRAGRTAGALEGLSIETIILFVPAVIYVVWLEAGGAGTFFDNGVGHSLLMIGLGLVTAVPLIMFGAAARRVPLSWVGMLQYVAPIMQFVFGLTVFHEDMPPARWVGFALVWAALVVLTIDILRRRNRSRRNRLAAA
jgi:chloramphenicol-sensitive protein RarD